MKAYYYLGQQFNQIDFSGSALDPNKLITQDGEVTLKPGGIVDADINANAAISTSKIGGLDGRLAGLASQNASTVTGFTSIADIAGTRGRGYYAISATDYSNITDKPPFVINTGAMFVRVEGFPTNMVVWAFSNTTSVETWVGKWYPGDTAVRNWRRIDNASIYYPTTISTGAYTTVFDLVTALGAGYWYIRTADATSYTDLPVGWIGGFHLHVDGYESNMPVTIISSVNGISYSRLWNTSGSTWNNDWRRLDNGGVTSGTVLGPPDIANIESINRISTSGGSWTVDRDGYVKIFWGKGGDGASQYLTVDGATVMAGDPDVGGQGVTADYRYWPVRKNQVITLQGSTPSSSYYPFGCWFVPALPAVLDVPTTNTVFNVGQPDFTQVQTKATGVGSGAATLAWTVDKDGYVWNDGGCNGTTGTMYINVNGRTFTLGTSIASDWINSTAVPMYLKAGTVYTVGVTAQMKWQAAGVPHIYWCPAELTPPVYLEAAPVLNYSTAEQETAEKWVDGKTIYRRVLTVTRDAMVAGNNYSIANLPGCHIIRYDMPFYLVTDAADGMESTVGRLLQNVGGNVSFSCLITTSNSVAETFYFPIWYTK